MISKKITFVILTLLILSSFIFADDPPKFKYIGAEACGKCHKSEGQGRQLIIWKESLHSHAYQTLKSEEAVKIAKDLGYEKTPTELYECLICHASGHDVDSTLLEKGFKIEDGIQCESCHGPGSEYKAIKIMKSRELAIQNGLVKVFENTEGFCRDCHNPDSPTFAGFNFETAWSKIQHYIPVKKNE